MTININQNPSINLLSDCGLSVIAAGTLSAMRCEIVPAALKALHKGAALVLGGIYMSPIPEFDYDLLYGERIVRSVANKTREDGHEFLKEAAAIGLTTSVVTFPLEGANDALITLKNDAIKSGGVGRSLTTGYLPSGGWTGSKA